MRSFKEILSTFVFPQKSRVVQKSETLTVIILERNSNFKNDFEFQIPKISIKKLLTTFETSIQKTEILRIFFPQHNDNLEINFGIFGTRIFFEFG